MDLILADMEKYKTTNVNFHAGDVIQHSIWSALYMNSFFDRSSSELGGLGMEHKKLMVVAAVLHDIGKCGDEVYTFFDKPAHPEIGGYYFSQGKYLNIDLRQVISDLGVDYHIVHFLVRWHWMIGGVLRLNGRKDWMVYYHFNIACHEFNISMDMRPILFKMLYAIWVADIMASQRYEGSKKTGIPEIDKYGNMESVHPGGDMYRKLEVDETFRIRRDVLELYKTGITNVKNNFKQKMTVFIKSIVKIGDMYYNYKDSDHPLRWERARNLEIKGLTKETSKELRENVEICKDFLEHSNPNQIPLVQGFPELAELSKDYLAELYGILCLQNKTFQYNFIPPNNELKDELKDEDKVWLNANKLLYHGRGYVTCEPPNIGLSRPFWVFDKKNLAYSFATGRGKETVFLKENKGCWNIITYRTTKDIPLLNLGRRETRDKLREILKNYKCDQECYRNRFLMQAFPNQYCITYDLIIDLMFPKDKNEEKERFSYVDVNVIIINVFLKLFPSIKGWYIQKTNYPEETCIFRPYDNLIIERHDYYDYNKLRSLFEACYATGDEDECNNKITKSFKKNNVVCLEDKANNRIECFLLEELASKVPADRVEEITQRVRDGELMFELV